MKQTYGVIFYLLLASPFAFADKPRHGPQSIEVKVPVGSVDGAMKFFPDKLTFERGNYYKLVISNPSADEHYFTSDAFSTHIFNAQNRRERLERQHRGRTMAQ